jgi:BirA family biotin operon repressor/biotin-[acetyl-CoA-carboxylase] ligase
LASTVPLPPGYRHRHFGEIGSTNDLVRAAAMGGEPAGLVVTADVQTAGRGRRGREWVSPAGNLYSSILLRPGVAPAAGGQLSFVVALAVADAVAEALPGAPVISCKWPNDVLVNGAKVAGILLESQTAGNGLLDWVIVGTGINVASHPPLAQYPATSLAANGAAGGAQALLPRYLRRLDHWLSRWQTEGFGPVREAWLSRAWKLGSIVSVRIGEEPVQGVFETLDAQGALVLSSGGARRTIAAGEILAA